MSRSVGPQIRGGESAAIVRFSSRPVDCLDDRFDLLVGLDWLNVCRFADEIPLDSHSLIVFDPAAGDIPDALAISNARVLNLPIKELASSVDGGRANMVALGIVGGLSGLSLEAVTESTQQILSGKADRVVNTAVECIAKGFSSVNKKMRLPEITSSEPDKPRWNISGNKAGGLGALRGGVRFVAAYPITPASDMLAWLAPRLERLGGSLLQAEDELASINMLIGTSFGGVPAMTVTSGPGLSLMAEGLGLAVVSETPVVVANVTRGGPSTGNPTKPEQSDINLALYGMHGDAPHLVLAPLSIGDCAITIEWAVGLAERLQTVAIVLSDQYLGQTRAIIDPVESAAFDLQREIHHSSPEPYLRYQLTQDGVSPMAVPGMSDSMYIGEGLAHNERGIPSSMAADHLAQLDKRQSKLKDFNYGGDWAEVEGEGEICLLTWAHPRVQYLRPPTGCVNRDRQCVS